VLSAQCTDVRVNKVTRELFKKYQTAEDYAQAKISTLEKEIGSVTYFRSKSKYLKRIGELLLEKHDGEVPSTMEELIELPGVGKKTASLIMAKAFGELEGVAVDTHVRRLSQRLELTDHAH
jgi:endonuclease-3